MEGSSPNPDVPSVIRWETDAEGRVMDPGQRARMREIALTALAGEGEGIERDLGLGEGKRRALSGAANEPFSPIKPSNQ